MRVRKLTKKQERAIMGLARGENQTWSSRGRDIRLGYSDCNYRNRHGLPTYIGATTIVSLEKRGLVVFAAARATLTPGGHSLARVLLGEDTALDRVATIVAEVVNVD